MGTSSGISVIKKRVTNIDAIPKNRRRKYIILRRFIFLPPNIHQIIVHIQLAPDKLAMQWAEFLFQGA
jgi:hypothetical protein